MNTIKGILKKLLPGDTACGRLVRNSISCVLSLLWVKKLHKKIELYFFDKRVAHLMDSDLLNKKIKKVQAMAESDDIKKKFFVIVWSGPGNVGLCSCVFAFVYSIAYSIAVGKIPVIDMQSYPNDYLEEEKIGKENAWEYYFEQPFGYDLDSVREESEVSRGLRISWDLPIKMVGSELGFVTLFQMWATIFRHYVHLNDVTEKYIDEEYDRLFKPGMRVLGVNCRGADYNPVMASGHSIQPDIDTLIAKVKTAMVEWDCDNIFLAAPEKKSFDIFNSHFPGKVLQNKAALYDNADVDFTKQFLGSVKFDRANDAYLKGLEYLTTIVLLSRCTSAVFGLTAGSMMARYINDGKYENIYVFDLGKY